VTTGSFVQSDSPSPINEVCQIKSKLLHVKNEEYRELKDYWKKRLEERTYDIVRFRNGYAADAPVMDVEFLGVDKRQDCYAIRLGKILRLERWRGTP